MKIAYKPRTFFELAMAMKLHALVEINGAKGYIIGIDKEDGSGYNWNVKMNIGIKMTTSVFFSEGC